MSAYDTVNPYFVIPQMVLFVVGIIIILLVIWPVASIVQGAKEKADTGKSSPSLIAASTWIALLFGIPLILFIIKSLGGSSALIPATLPMPSMAIPRIPVVPRGPVIPRAPVVPRVSALPKISPLGRHSIIKKPLGQSSVKNPLRVIGRTRPHRG